MMPLAFPFSSVLIGELKPISEFPATPLYLESALVHLETSIPSKKGYTLVNGFSLLIVNLTAVDLA